MADVQPTEGTFGCGMCDAHFESKVSLVEHCQMAHVDLSLYECHKCSKLFANSVAVKKHILESHCREFTCQLCQQKLMHYDQLRRHMKALHCISPLFSCVCCALVFAKNKDQRQHLKSMLEMKGPGDVTIIAFCSDEVAPQTSNHPPSTSSEDQQSSSTSSPPNAPVDRSRVLTCNCCKWVFASHEDMMHHIESMCSTGTPGDVTPIDKNKTSESAAPNDFFSLLKSTTTPPAPGALVPANNLNLQAAAVTAIVNMMVANNPALRALVLANLENCSTRTSQPTGQLSLTTTSSIENNNENEPSTSRKRPASAIRNDDDIPAKKSIR